MMMRDLLLLASAESVAGGLAAVLCLCVLCCCFCFEFEAVCLIFVSSEHFCFLIGLTDGLLFRLQWLPVMGWIFLALFLL